MLQIHFNIFEEFETISEPIKIIEAEPIKQEYKTTKIEYVKILSVKSIVYQVYEVTAYTAGFESTGKKKGDPMYGVTASGKKVRPWHTVACSTSLEFGTQIYIPYFNKVFMCEDRGSAITEGKIDVYMESLDDALKFGRQKIKVKIL